MSPLRAAAAALLLLTTSLGAGCREPEAGLHVEVDGPLTPGVDFDRLTLNAYLASDRTPLFADVQDAPTLPVTFNLVSGKGTPEGTEVEVVASAELNGEVVSATRATGTLKGGEGATLTLTLPAVTPKPSGGVVEACDDGVDDDGDGLADCADSPECDGKACGPGGMTCRMGACRCANGTLGVWTPSTPGFAPRAGAQALALTKGPATGAVVIAGGVDSSGAPSGTVELYRPGLSLDTIAVGTPRVDATMFADDAGTVRIAGGEAIAPDGGTVQATLPVEELDYAQLLTVARPLSPGVAFDGAHAIPYGGGWLLVGGSLGKDVFTLAPSSDGGTGWSATLFATLGAAREDAVVLEDGRVFFASGPVATDSTELLSADGGIAVGPRLPVAVAHAALAPIPGGRAVVIGGAVQGAPSASAYVIAVSGDAVAVRRVGDLSAPRATPRAYPLGNGWVYVESPGVAAGEWFDFASTHFVPATPPQVSTTNAAIAPFSARVFRSGGTLPGGGVSDEGAFLQLQCAP